MTTLSFDSRLDSGFDARFGARPVLVRSTATAPSRVRLTRRGERVLAAVIALSIAATVYVLGALYSASVQAGDHSLPATTTAVVVVSAGESLWSIATSVDPSGDPRAMIERIQDLNGLADGATVFAGQSLVVPVLT